MRSLILLLLIVPLSLFGQENEDVWQPFDYFVGSWKGHETGASGIGKGERTYEYIMDGKYLFFKNRSVFEPQKKNPKGEVHQDWTFFSYDTFRKKFVMRQFNSEGFVNQYTLDSLSTDGRTLRFVSESIENAPPGFRTRITLNIRNENEFGETFELAPPGKEFKVILENRWKRTK